MKDKLSKFVCGFRKGFSCEDALLRLLETWRGYLDKGEIIGTVLSEPQAKYMTYTRSTAK